MFLEFEQHLVTALRLIYFMVFCFNRPRVLNRPVMIVGADVTHPSPDQTDIPSVAAVSI